MNFNYIFDKNINLLERIIKKEYEKNKDNIDTTYHYYQLDDFINHAKSGSISRERALVIYSLLKKFKPKKILEIGSFLGISTKIINDTLGGKCKIVSVDPNVRHRIFDNPRKYFDLINKNYNNITKINKIFSNISLETGKWDYFNYEPKIDKYKVKEILSNIGIIDYSFFFTEKFDCCFIDGSHDYKSVINNFIDSIKILHEGSIILFDDYNPLDWKETYDAINHIIKIGGNNIECVKRNDIVLIKDKGFFEKIIKNPNIILKKN